MTQRADRGEQPLSLTDSATHLLNEGRMVLPGIQALFGFQLIAVFNQGFAQELSASEQILHLAATVLVAIAVALVMTPTALHRQLEPRGVSEGLVLISSRLLLWSMVPLALGISLDLYLVARVILGAAVPAAVIAVGLLALYLGLWFLLPRSRVVRRMMGAGG
ncbi:MAG: DUF6328 family protein [Gemmatimonadaceae bacterium]